MKSPLLLFFIFLSSISFGQNIKQDSLKIKTALNQIIVSDSIEEQNYYFDYVNKIAQKTKNINLWVNLYYSKAKSLYNRKEFGKAEPFYLKVDSIATRYNLKNELIVKSILDRSEILRTTFTYDGVENAHKLQNEALNLAKDINSEKLINNIYLRLADMNGLIGNYNKVKTYNDLAFSFFLKKNNYNKLSLIYLTYVNYYYVTENLDKAKKKLDEGISYFRSNNSQKELAVLLVSYGDFYRKKKKNCKKAIIKYYEAKSIFEKLNQKLSSRYLYLMEGLALCSADIKEYKNAYNYFKETYSIKKALLKKANNNLTLGLEKKYQTQKKEHQITLLKTEKKLATQQKTNQRNLFITGIGITSLAGLFFFFLFRNKQKTTKKLKELAKLKSNLIANISHEFRTPLTLISGPIQQQLKKKGLSKNDRTNFGIIQQNTKRLLALVNQLLDVSKIESGATKLNVAQHQLIPFINLLTKRFSFAATQKNIHLKTHYPKTTIKTWFDKDIVEKIITNLLSNALKYTQKNGTINCTSNLQNNNWIFEVKNTGKGIAKNEINKIFSRFYQQNKNAEGVGIGLALVKELALIHKGKIMVESEPNQWTSFKVILPINKNSFKPDEILNKTPISNTFKTTDFSESTTTNINLNTKISEENEQPILLVVDDNKEVLTYISNLFKNSYKILQAVNGEEGINLAFKYVPDIIISDVMMPVKDGVELCNTLKIDERTNHIPVILLTAKAGDENKITGIKTGADAYITKPFNNEFLQLKVSQLIAVRKKLQKRYSQEVILKPTDIAVNSIDELFLERVQKVLDTNLIESSFHISEFCKAVGMSRMQLHRKLKVLTGLSTSEFIRSQRLKLAAQLLKTSEINISQVGYSVGFNNHAYFSKCFKKMYNCTPSEYAKN